MRVASGHEAPTAGNGTSPRGRALLPTTTVAPEVPSRHEAGAWPPSPSLLFLLPVLPRARPCQLGCLWPSHWSGTRKWEGKHDAAHTKARLPCMGRQQGAGGERGHLTPPRGGRGSARWHLHAEGPRPGHLLQVWPWSVLLYRQAPGVLVTRGGHPGCSLRLGMCAWLKTEGWLSGRSESSGAQDNQRCSKVKRNLPITLCLDSGIWKQQSCALLVLTMVQCEVEVSLS